MSCSTKLPRQLRQSFLLGSLVIVLVLALLIAHPHSARAAGIIHVVPGGAGSRSGANWANAKDLQEALASAISGDQLWVKAGIYKPTTGTDRTATFQLRNGVAVYGGFAGTETALGQRDVAANVTILSGDLLGNDVGIISITNPTRADNSYHVVETNGVDRTTILDGLTISDGNANGSGSPYYYAGGIYIVSGSPTLRNVVFSSNTASDAGGAVESDYGQPLFSHITFVNNTASFGGGGLFAYYSDMKVIDSSFYGNFSDRGGAIFNYSSSSIISNVLFSSNNAEDSGGGIYNTASGIPIISQATFSNNTANVGGGMTNSGGGSNPIVRNSIFWGNRGGQIYNWPDNTPTVQFSLIQGGYINGTSILDADPLFVDTDGADNITGTLDDDLRLQLGSPAIDVGNNAFIPVDATDEDGDGDTAELAPVDLHSNPRIVNGSVDMGAYEFQVFTSSIPPSPVTYGSIYTHTFTASVAPATFGVTAGSLPQGLTLVPNGLLSGTLSAAGVYTATVTSTSAGWSDAQTFRIVVNRAPLTIRADNASRVVGSSNPFFSATYTGFVRGDTPASLDGKLVLTTTATSASPPGVYPIRPTGLSSTNYAIVYVNGVLTITPCLIYLPVLRR